MGYTGESREGRMALVVYTYIEIDAERVSIRILSARKPTKREIRQYEEGSSA